MYCGKCGRKLGTNGKCPVCDPSGQRNPKTWLVVLVLILGVGILTAAWIYKPGRRNSELPVKTSASDVAKTSKPAPASVESPDDPISVFFRTEIAPNYPQAEKYLNIPYRSWCHQEGSNKLGVSFVETQEGPVALLGTSRADFNVDGTEDLMVVTLDADKISDLEMEKYNTPERDQYGLMDGLYALNLKVALYLFDPNGNTLCPSFNGITQPSYAYSRRIDPEIDNTFAIYISGDNLVFCHSWDEGRKIIDSEGVPLFYPVANISSHADEICIFHNEMTDASYEYCAFRSMSYSSDQKKITGVRYYEKNKDDVMWKTLYQDAEEIAVGRINEVLCDAYGFPKTDFRPTSWRMRWANTFLSGDDLDGLIAYVNFTSDFSERSSMSDTGGMISVNYEPIMNAKPGIPWDRKSEASSMDIQESGASDILEQTLDFSKKWSYASTYRVYPNDSEKYYDQDFRACFTFYDDKTFDLLIYEPYSDVFFSKVGKYKCFGENVEFTIFSSGKRYNYTYRFDADMLTFAQLSETGIGNLFSEKGTVHQLEEAPFLNG